MNNHGAHLLAGDVRMPRLRAITVALMLLALVPWSGAHAGETSQPATAWWHRGPVDVPSVVPVPGDDALRSPAVDVPPGGLYVANDPTGPRAVAAVRFADASGPATLRIELADAAVMSLGARLMACAISPTWIPVENAAWSDRPSIECRSGVEGQFVDDGSVVEFGIHDLDTFRTPRGTEFAVAPADDEVVPFNLAFEPPEHRSLVAGLPPTSSPTTTVPSTVEPAASHEVPPPPTTLALLSRPPATVQLDALPPPPDTAMDGQRDDDQHAVAPSHTRSIAVPVDQDLDGRARAALTALTAALAAAAWIASGARGAHPEIRSVTHETTS